MAHLCDTLNLAQARWTNSLRWKYPELFKQGAHHSSEKNIVRTAVSLFTFTLLEEVQRRKSEEQELLAAIRCTLKMKQC